jgi:hypothetical protein
MDKYPKFIIEGENLILMMATYHKDIVVDKTKVRGGGWFKYVSDKKMYIFYGDSHDFGKAKFDDIKKCVEQGNVFSDYLLVNNITSRYSFGYDTGTEIIELKNNN